MDIIDPNEVAQLIYGEPDSIRARKLAAREVASIGAWNAELELRQQERTFKSARKGNAHTSGVSDAFPYQAPKHRRANTGNRKRLDFHGICISYKLRARELYFYAHPLGYYFSAYRHGHITRGELDSILANIKLMGEEVS